MSEEINFSKLEAIKLNENLSSMKTSLNLNTLELKKFNENFKELMKVLEAKK